MRRDEWFQLVRWINLALGLQGLYYYVVLSAPVSLAIGALNIAVFVFSRQIRVK